MDREERFRLAESLVQQAKKLLWEEWDDYADVQEAMGKLEDARMYLDILISKHNSNTLK